MNNKLNLLMILLFSVKVIFACDVCTTCFCEFMNKTNHDLIFTGEIIFIDSAKVSIKVEDILHGEEERDTLTIWANKDILVAEGTTCEELVSGTTRILGQKNDHILIGINKIQLSENEWDVVGDYRVPFYLYNTPWLKVENDTVYGRIYVDNACDPTRRIDKKSYSEFKAHWSDRNFNCDNLVSSEFVSKNEIDFKQIDQIITIYHETNSTFHTTVYNISGKLLYSAQSDCECQIDLNYLEKGILIVNVSEEGRTFFTQKVFNH